MSSYIHVIEGIVEYLLKVLTYIVKSVSVGIAAPRPVLPALHALLVERGLKPRSLSYN